MSAVVAWADLLCSSGRAFAPKDGGVRGGERFSPVRRAMSKCAVCGAYSAKMFLPDGSPACNRCFYAEDTHRKEDTSSKQAITGGYAAIAVGLLGIVFCVLIGAKKLAVVPGLFLTGGVAGIRFGKATQRRLAAKRDLEPFG